MRLPRKRLRLPRRILPKRRPYRKAPSEKTLVALAPKIEQRLLGILKPLDAKGNVVVRNSGDTFNLGNIIKIRNADLMAKSTSQAVVDIGAFRVGARTIRLVGKFERLREDWLRFTQEKFGSRGTYAYSNNYLPGRIEATAHFLHRRGFPVSFKKSIKIGEATAVLISENLERKGHQLEDALGFDFGKLRNGKELHSQLEEYVRKLKEMEQRGEIEVNQHLHPTKKISMKIAENCFFVRHKNGIGELIMEDLSNIKKTGYVWDREKDQNLMENREDAIKESGKLKGFFP